MSIAKLNEPALLAAGFPRDVVEALRHILLQAGKIKGATTLPEVAALTDSLTPIVSGLVISLTVTNQNVAYLEAATSENMRSDAHLLARLDTLDAENERARTDRNALLRLIEDAVIAADIQTLNIAELRRRIAQLEDA